MAVQREFEEMVEVRGRGAASDLAHRLGVSSQTVSRWRKDGLPASRWVDVAVALGELDQLRLVRLSTLFDEQPELRQELEQLHDDQLQEAWRSIVQGPQRGRVGEPEMYELLTEVLERLDQLEREVGELPGRVGSYIAGRVSTPLDDVDTTKIPDDELRVELAKRPHDDGQSDAHRVG